MGVVEVVEGQDDEARDDDDTKWAGFRIAACLVRDIGVPAFDGEKGPKEQMAVGDTEHVSAVVGHRAGLQDETDKGDNPVGKMLGADLMDKSAEIDNQGREATEVSVAGSTAYLGRQQAHQSCHMIVDSLRSSKFRRLRLRRPRFRNIGWGLVHSSCWFGRGAKELLKARRESSAGSLDEFLSCFHCATGQQVVGGIKRLDRFDWSDGLLRPEKGDEGLGAISPLSVVAIFAMCGNHVDTWSEVDQIIGDGCKVAGPECFIVVHPRGLSLLVSWLVPVRTDGILD